MRRVAGLLHDGDFFRGPAGALISLYRNEAVNGRACGGVAKIE